MDMILTHNLLYGLFRLLSRLNNLVTVILFILVLLKVLFDHTVAQFHQLHHFGHQLVVHRVLFHLFELSRGGLFLLLGGPFGDSAHLSLEIGQLVPRHFLWRLQIELTLVLLVRVSGRHWSVDGRDVAIRPIPLPVLRLSGVPRDHWQLELGIFHLLLHQRANVNAELRVQVLRLRLHYVVVKAAPLHDSSAGFHRDPDAKIHSQDLTEERALHDVWLHGDQ